MVLTSNVREFLYIFPSSKPVVVETPTWARTNPWARRPSMPVESLRPRPRGDQTNPLQTAWQHMSHGLVMSGHYMGVSKMGVPPKSSNLSGFPWISPILNHPAKKGVPPMSMETSIYNIDAFYPDLRRLRGGH